MKKQDEIQSRIEKMIEIIILAKTSIYDIEYIFNNLQAKGRTKYDKLFTRLWTAMWYHAIIETSKLFDSSHNGYYGFKKLNNMLENNFNKLHWKRNKMTLQEINQTIQKFNNDSRIVSIVSSIKTARDEHFAHSDMKPNFFEAKSEDVKLLLDMSGNLLNVFCENLFDYRHHFDLSQNDLQHYLFEPLFKDENKQMDTNEIKTLP